MMKTGVALVKVMPGQVGERDGLRVFRETAIVGAVEPSILFDDVRVEDRFWFLPDLGHQANLSVRGSKADHPAERLPLITRAGEKFSAVCRFAALLMN
ncbi:MAG: hypothetical protein ABSG88_12750 [Bradyrhizobium sp.]